MQNMKNQTDNGWYHIKDNTPNAEETVIVILERESSMVGSYDFEICESIYRNGYPNGHFSKENSAWKVRFWRRKEILPYPNAVAKRKIEECRKNNVNPYKIIEHQKKCGIDIETE